MTIKIARSPKGSKEAFTLVNTDQRNLDAAFGHNEPDRKTSAKEKALWGFAGAAIVAALINYGVSGADRDDVSNPEGAGVNSVPTHVQEVAVDNQD